MGLLAKRAGITWSERASATAATATATKVAAPRMRHIIKSISISATAAPSAAVDVLLQSGATVLDEFRIPAAAFAPIVISYDDLRGGINEAITLAIPSLGAGVTATAVIKGATVAE